VTDTTNNPEDHFTNSVEGYQFVGYIGPDEPSWHYEEPATGRTISYTVGYIVPLTDAGRPIIDKQQPCMALFAGDDDTPVLIPAGILVHVFEMGAEQEQAENARWN
jgi:hypothetical protein